MYELLQKNLAVVWFHANRTFNPICYYKSDDDCQASLFTFVLQRSDAAPSRFASRYQTTLP